VPDEESFGRYVIEAYPALLRRAHLLVGDHGHAEDLVQVSLASAYTRWRLVRQPLRANGLLAQEGQLR
jgi:DNA-directed RNA polymerase specialized sigma24 family protein